MLYDDNLLSSVKQVGLTFYSHCHKYVTVINAWEPSISVFDLIFGATVVILSLRASRGNEAGKMEVILHATLMIRKVVE